MTLLHLSAGVLLVLWFLCLVILGCFLGVCLGFFFFKFHYSPSQGAKPHVGLENCYTTTHLVLAIF